MVRTLDDITKQAQQGSVAAIIQVLNADLAESGVRARAVLSQGVLQLLCEADSPSKLNQSNLVEQLHMRLNQIQPRYVRRVRVNTRLVSEQQLLWLDEIERDPDGQLLWTAEFSIQRPRLDQQLRNTWHDWQERNHPPITVLADTAQRERRKKHLWQAIIGGSGLFLFLCLVGWVAYDFLDLGQRRSAVTVAPGQDVDPAQDNNALTVVDEPNPTTSNSPDLPPNSPEGAADQASLPEPSNQSQASSEIQPNPGEADSGEADSGQLDNNQPDPFVQAVRIAEQSVAAGQSATTVDEWMELAAQWQRASELMNSVPADDGRYATAQNRTTLYLQNSVDSRRQAELVRQKQDEQSAQPL
ncbi:MAG: hypothetical protein VKJ64_21865 [Leptolyngbyaceae bacterium]|nr:hypothetical protein [Leptolyngbyaceae bacterium]